MKNRHKKFKYLVVEDCFYREGETFVYEKITPVFILDTLYNAERDDKSLHRIDDDELVLYRL